MRGSAPARRWAAPALIVVVAYVPALLTARGWVATDTKQYLYLDPGRLLRAAAYLWDPVQFGGHVTHQIIGYLFPMGPFFLAAEHLGLPDWFAQRLWLGTLLAAAGLGVHWCARLFGLRRSAALAVGVLYGLSPYLLGYASRTSILLTPWSGLGWQVGLAVLACRRGGWRAPALFALVTFTVGGQNATAVALALLAPALWLVHAAATRQVPVRAAAAAAARLAVLSAGVSAWWAIAVLVLGRYGSDVLSYSETLEAVSTTSLASEVARGLGYWLFYGSDALGPWTSSSVPYQRNPGLIGLGFGLVALGVVALVTVRWSQRTYLVLLVATGTVAAVGAHPFDDPSPIGAFLKGGAAESAAVLALRSSTRAVPLVLFGLALGIGALLDAAGRLGRPARHRLALASGAAVVVVVLAVVNLPALWNGTYVDASLRRPEDVPAWWPEAAAALDAGGDASRVLELAGQEFAAYQWGMTIDPLLPGYTDRPLVTRDLLPLGSPELMDLVFAFDDRFQNGTFEPTSLAPIAALLGVGDVVLRGDAEFERYRTPRPDVLWAGFADGVPGLGPPTTYGPPAPNRPEVEMVDEIALSDPAVDTAVPPVAVFPVDDARPVVRAVDGDHLTMYSGDGAGLVDLAAAGLLADPGVLVASASVTDPDRLREIAAGADLLVTDQHRLRARQWRSSQDTTGATEDGRPDWSLTDDPADARLPVFPDAPVEAFTVAEQRGGARVTATGYGDEVSYRPEDRPAQAFDGDPSTGWLVGDRGEALGARLRIDLEPPRPVHTLTLVGDPRSRTRTITEVTVRTDTGEVVVPLDGRSQQPDGQVLELPAGTERFVELEITGTDPGRLVSYFAVDGVGFAEVRLDDLVLEEVVRPPTDLLDALGPASLDQPLTFVLTRQRVDPRKRWRDDEERALVRALRTPAARAFGLSGSARLAARADDAVTDRLLDPESPIEVHTSSRLAGVPTQRGRNAIDGDPGTVWTTAFGSTVEEPDARPEGEWIEVRTDQPVTFDRLDLVVVNDGLHSVPDQVLVEAGGEDRLVDLPPVPLTPPGALAADLEATVSLPATFEPLTGDVVRVTFTGVQPAWTLDRTRGQGTRLPVSVAELGLPGVVASPLPGSFDTGCRSDLLTVGDQAAPVRVAGDTAAALRGGALAVEPCGPPVRLGPDEQVLRVAPGTVTGIDLDRLVLRSAAGGDAMIGPPTPGAAATGGGLAAAGPAVVVERNDRTSRRYTVTGHDGPFWLVLGEGRNDGWRASVDGRSLGAPVAVDGGASAWLVTPAGDGPVVVTAEWVPQRVVWVGLAVSVVTVGACLVILVVSWWRRRRARATAGPAPALDTAPPVPDRPVVGDPTRGGRARSWWRIVAGAAAAGLVAGLAAHPQWGVVVGGATAVALLVPRARLLLTGGAVVGAVATGVLMVHRQWVDAPLPGFGWVANFPEAHTLMLAAVLCLAADAIRERAAGTCILAGHEPDAPGQGADTAPGPDGNDVQPQAPAGWS